MLGGHVPERHRRHRRVVQVNPPHDRRVDLLADGDVADVGLRLALGQRKQGGLERRQDAPDVLPDQSGDGRTRLRSGHALRRETPLGFVVRERDPTVRVERHDGVGELGEERAHCALGFLGAMEQRVGAQERGGARHQLDRVVGLANEVVGARRQRLADGLRLVIAREHQDRRRARPGIGAQELADFDPADARHLPVDDPEIGRGRAVGERFERHVAVLKRPNLERRLERASRGLGFERSVVDEPDKSALRQRTSRTALLPDGGGYLC